MFGMLVVVTNLVVLCTMSSEPQIYALGLQKAGTSIMSRAIAGDRCGSNPALPPQVPLSPAPPCQWHICRTKDLPTFAAGLASTYSAEAIDACCRRIGKAIPCYANSSSLLFEVRAEGFEPRAFRSGAKIQWTPTPLELRSEGWAFESLAP